MTNVSRNGFILSNLHVLKSHHCPMPFPRKTKKK